MAGEYVVNVSFTVKAKDREQARNITRRYLEQSDPPPAISDTFEVHTNVIATGSFTRDELS